MDPPAHDRREGCANNRSGEEGGPIATRLVGYVPISDSLRRRHLAGGQAPILKACQLCGFSSRPGGSVGHVLSFAGRRSTAQERPLTLSLTELVDTDVETLPP